MEGVDRGAQHRARRTDQWRQCIGERRLPGAVDSVDPDQDAPARPGRGNLPGEASQDLPMLTPADDAVLVFDGIFLHRPELVDCWDVSVFLDVDFAVSIPRGAQRGYGDPDPAAASNHRYVGGQQIYLDECQPRRLATYVIDNLDVP